MRVSIKVLAACALLLFFVDNAYAISGNEFLSQCDNYAVPKATFSQGFCLGIVVGVAEISRMVCIPKGVTNKQAVLVVEKYLKDNPQNLHHSATELIEYSLSVSWPCKK